MSRLFFIGTILLYFITFFTAFADYDAGSAVFERKPNSPDSFSTEIKVSYFNWKERTETRYGVNDYCGTTRRCHDVCMDVPYNVCNDECGYINKNVCEQVCDSSGSTGGGGNSGDGSTGGGGYSGGSGSSGGSGGSGSGGGSSWGSWDDDWSSSGGSWDDDDDDDSGWGGFALGYNCHDECHTESKYVCNNVCHTNYRKDCHQECQNVTNECNYPVVVDYKDYYKTETYRIQLILDKNNLRFGETEQYIFSFTPGKIFLKIINQRNNYEFADSVTVQPEGSASFNIRSKGRILLKTANKLSAEFGSTTIVFKDPEAQFNIDSKNLYKIEVIEIDNNKSVFSETFEEFPDGGYNFDLSKQGFKPFKNYALHYQMKRTNPEVFKDEWSEEKELVFYNDGLNFVQKRFEKVKPENSLEIVLNNGSTAGTLAVKDTIREKTTDCINSYEITVTTKESKEEKVVFQKVLNDLGTEGYLIVPEGGSFKKRQDYFIKIRVKRDNSDYYSSEWSDEKKQSFYDDGKQLVANRSAEGNNGGCGIISSSESSTIILFLFMVLIFLFL